MDLPGAPFARADLARGTLLRGAQRKLWAPEERYGDLGGYRGAQRNAMGTGPAVLKKLIVEKKANLADTILASASSTTTCDCSSDSENVM